MIRINLLPKRPKALVMLYMDGAILGGVILVLLIVWTAVFARMNGKLNKVRREMKETRRQIEESKLDLEKVEKLKQRKVVLENKINIIHSLREKQAGPVHVLDDLSQAIPEQVWIDNMSNMGQSLRLAGMSPSYNAVSEFMKELSLSPYFNNVELENIQQSVIKGKKFQKFRITCKVSFNPPSPKKDAKGVKEKKT